MNAQKRQCVQYVIADFLSTNVALLLFNVFRYFDLPVAYKSFASLGDFLGSPMLLAGQLLFPLLMMGVYFLSGVYDDVFKRSRTKEFAVTLVTAFIGTLILFFVALINDLTLERTRDYSLFFILLILMFLTVYVPRVILTCRMVRRVIGGEISFPAVIVGYSSVPQLFPRQIEKIAHVVGVRPVALVDSENKARYCTTGTDLPVYDISQIKEVCMEYGAERVIVIPHPEGWDRTLDVVNSLFLLDMPLYVAAEDLPSHMFNLRIMSLLAEPFIDITRTRMSASTLHLKRLSDIVVSSLMVILCSVPLALLAVAVKMDSPGPAFYRQRRVGLHRRQFNIIKLRTMRRDAEADGRPRLSYPGDTRVTRLGRVLRKYRLDELPQFMNVLRGDMSLVGPRPERPEFVEEMHVREPSSILIHRVRPGITSLGQVRYGYASDMDAIMRRLQYDLLYLDNISLLTDLKVILHTVHTVLSGRGV